MKVGGVENDKTFLYGPIVFKRGPKTFLRFVAQPVWTLDEFNAKCPPPVNKNYVFTKDGKQIDDEAPAYKHDLKEYYRKRWAWIVIKSLEPSEIEWDLVKPDDPNTWVLVEEDLRANLSIYEFAAVMKLVDEANALDDQKLEENLKTFFQMEAQRTDQNTQTPEAASS